MSIKYAILGLLSCQSMSGYDMKKIMQESSFMYWSGNNNQIYKALVQLHEEGCAEDNVVHRDGAPSKKVYSITEKGREELREWLKKEPEASDLKKPFFIKLAFSHSLSNDELEALIDDYDKEINGRIAIEKEKQNRDLFMPKRTEREKAVWQLIHENTIGMLEYELEWIKKAKTEIGRFKMVYEVINKNGEKYVMFGKGGSLIGQKQDASELISICAENEVNRMLIEGDRLSEDFVKLSTGAAGEIVQKLVQYNIKTAVVLEPDSIKGRFKEFAVEINSGNMFRCCDSFDEAEHWLLA